MKVKKYILSLLTLLLFAGVALPLFAAGPNGPVGEEEENCDGTTCNLLPNDYITQMTAGQIQAYYTRRHKFDGFNGSVLVAKDGKPLYEGAFGYGNYILKDTLSTNSSFQLASVTKTFTSAAVLKLVEQGLISLDDTLSELFPGFPYEGVTIRHLLCHRSGLPEYIYWSQDFIGRDVKYLSNQALLDLLITKKPPIRCKPDRIFLYTNTNYALLALVVEKVSGVSFPKYMQDNIFTPLGMTNTFVCAMDDSTINCGATCYQARRWREWALSFSDGVYGDKGIYSSVEDMLKWDNALRAGKVLSVEMLEQAYKPHSLDRYSFAKEKAKNYGLGWRMIKQRDGSYLIYHNGNWHGCNNVFARNLKDGYTIIVLGNKENEANYMTQPIWDILTRMRNEENVAASMQE